MPDHEEAVKLSIRGHIALITLNTPAKHNAVTAADMQLFKAHLQRLRETPDLRVLVLTGAGEKTFCAGAALDQMRSGSMDGELFNTLSDELAALSIPKICVFNGSAYGGGAELALCCDFRIGVEGMRMFVPAAKIGLCYPLSGIKRYVQRLGLITAKRILVAGEEFDDRALLDIGYLTHLVARDQLREAGLALATQIAAMAPLAVQTMKKICDQEAAGTLDEQQAQQWVAHCNQSEDLREGFLAREQGRSPVFRGR